MAIYNKYHRKAAILLICLCASILCACSGAPKKAAASSQACVDGATRTFYFNYGSSALDVATKESVKNLAQSMACYSGNIRLEGHTDSTSSSKFNKELGRKRAKAVEDFIVSLGIDPSRIKVITYGKDNPLVKGAGKEVDAQNRCVVVVFEGAAK